MNDKQCILQVFFTEQVLKLTNPPVNCLYKALPFRSRITVQEAIRIIADSTNLRSIPNEKFELYDRNHSTLLETDRTLESYFPAASTFVKNLVFRESTSPPPTQQQQRGGGEEEVQIVQTSPQISMSVPELPALPTNSNQQQQQPPNISSTRSPSPPQATIFQSSKSSASLPSRIGKEISRRFSINTKKESSSSSSSSVAAAAADSNSTTAATTKSAALKAPPVSYDSLEGMFWITSSEPFPMPAVFIEFKERDKKPIVSLTGSNSSSNSIIDDTSYFTILYCHDTGEDLGNIRRQWLEMLSESLRSNVLCFDYTGFGRHEGTTTEGACCRDALVAYLYLVTVKGVSGNRIIVCGKGLGSGPATFLSHTIATYSPKIQLPVRDVSWYQLNNNNSNSNINNSLEDKKERNKSRRLSLPLPIELPQIREIAGLILISTWIGLDLFDTEKRASRIPFPVLIIHGTSDKLVTINSIKKLSTKFPKLQSLIEVQGGTSLTNNNILDFCNEFLDEMATFLEHVSNNRYSFKRTIREAPIEFSNSPSLVITKWLEKRGFGSFAQSFLAFGFYDLESLKTITVDDLLGIGITNQVQQRAVLALISQSKNLANEHIIESICFERQIKDNAVYWLVTMTPFSEEQWIGIESLSTLDEKHCKTFLQSIAIFESTQKQTQPSSPPPPPTTTKSTPPTEKSRHIQHHGHHHRAQSGTNSPDLNIETKRRSSTNNTETTEPTSNSRRKGSLSSSTDAFEERAKLSSREISMPVVAKSKQQQQQQPRLEVREDPLHEFVRNALLPNESHELITIQLQILFSAGVFGLHTLETVAKSGKWKNVSEKLSPQLVSKIIEAYPPPPKSEEKEGEETTTRRRVPPQISSPPSQTTNLSEINVTLDSPLLATRHNRHQSVDDASLPQSQTQK